MRLSLTLERIADLMFEHRDRKIIVFMPLIRLSEQFRGNVPSAGDCR
jgi:hypothetical protein